MYLGYLETPSFTTIVQFLQLVALISMVFFCCQKVDLGSVMQKALIENKVEFVQLFLDSGVKLNKFLTVGRLEDLYQGVS